MQQYTLTYSESAQGWPSFYSFLPDWMIGMNNYFYTFKGGNLFRHNVNPVRCNFYGVQYSTKLKSVLNDSPLENKLFKTINLEGDAAWGVTLQTDIQDNGSIQAPWFEKKEQSWYAFVRNTGSVPASPSEYALRSVNGIGRSANVTGLPTSLEVRFPITPEPVVIGSIVSIGDYLYYALPPTYATPALCGIVTGVSVDYPTGNNKLIVNTTIPGGSVPSSTTPYFLYIKNSVAESHGVLGHYCLFELQNASTGKIELFAVESEVMKSYP